MGRALQVMGSFVAKYVEEAAGLELLSLLLCALRGLDEGRWRKMSRDLVGPPLLLLLLREHWLRRIGWCPCWAALG